MPALNLGDFRKGNIFFTLIVVAAVSVLLFIPDLIGINTESILDRDVDYTEPALQPAEEVAVSDQESAQEYYPDQALYEPEALPVSLVDIQTLLNSNYMDELVQEKIAAKRASVATDVRARPRAEIFDEEDARFSLGLPKLFNDKTGQGGIDIPDRLSWKFLQSKGVRRKFADMHVTATSVAASVSESYPETKYAMYDFSTTVKAMADGSQRFDSPTKAIDYIQYLDIKVLNKLREERVPRDVALRWSEISLEPIIGQISQHREQYLPKFDPEPKIVAFSIFTQQPKPTANSGLDVRNLRIAFRLRGKELVSVQAFVDRTKAPIYIFPPNAEEFRIAAFEGLELKGPIVFEVKDKFGYQARYKYDFTPLLKLGTWEKDPYNGVYKLKLSKKLLEGKGLDRFKSGNRAKPSTNDLFVQNGPLPYVVF